MAKLTTREELVPLVQSWRAAGKTVGFTSGAFDLLHAGHVDYLYQAKRACDLLIVGLNSDESIKRYKDPNRPIHPFERRAKVMAALEMVDYVFGFDELNNHVNIELLKPSLYIKAGDYSKDKLTSAPIVEKHGGKVLLIPVVEDTSTSKTIKKLIELEKGKAAGKPQPSDAEAGAPIAESLPLPERSGNVRVVFLDRDGTINKDISYLHEPEKFEFEKNAPEGLKALQEQGYRLVIVTDQPGIGLGYFTKEDLFRVNGQMFRLLSPFKIKFDRIYFCPHSADDQCGCRKPKVGLLERALESYSGRIDLQHSFFIGDKSSDIKCGRDFGLRTILVKTGSGGDDKRHPEATPDFVADDLLDAARLIREEG